MKMHDFQLFLPLFGAKSSDLVRKTYCNESLWITHLKGPTNLSTSNETEQNNSFFADLQTFYYENSYLPANVY